MLIEETFDWYAQDKQGNVWYLGEDSRELDENGNVISTEGSWEAGVDGAKAGIIMLADPKKGDRYQPGGRAGRGGGHGAGDRPRRIGLRALRLLRGVWLTKEWTPLERGVVERKYYAEGIGFIYSVMVKGGDEPRTRGHTGLVAITTTDTPKTDN